MPHSSLKLKPALFAALAALLAACGAFALGSQSDGNANAHKLGRPGATGPSGAQGPTGDRGHRGRRGHHGPRGAGLAELASTLGVDEAKLRTALKELRTELPGKAAGKDRAAGRTALIAAIAKQLGLSEAKVKAAFDKVRPAARPPAGDRKFRGGRRGSGSELIAALAKELGVSTAKLRTAFENAHEAQHEARQAERAATLAKAIGGVSAGGVAAALDKLRADRGPRGGRRGPGGRADIAAALAKELGVSEAKVTAGFEKLRAEHEAEHAKRRAAFAEALAKKLGISAGRVTEALGDRPLFGGRRGGRHHGPGHP